MDPKPIQPADRGPLASACPAFDIVRFLECGGQPSTEVKLTWPDWAKVSDEEAYQAVIRWSRSVLALSEASPAAQFEAVAPGLTQWAANLRRHQLAELVATLAVAYIAKTGLYHAPQFAGLSPLVVTGECNKSDLLAHFREREEAEIVVDPAAVEITAIVSIEADRVFDGEIEMNSGAEQSFASNPAGRESARQQSRRERLPR